MPKVNEIASLRYAKKTPVFVLTKYGKYYATEFKLVHIVEGKLKNLRIATFMKGKN